jgi:hypothetical protein
MSAEPGVGSGPPPCRVPALVIVAALAFQMPLLAKSSVLMRMQ